MRVIGSGLAHGKMRTTLRRIGEKHKKQWREKLALVEVPLPSGCLAHGYNHGPLVCCTWWCVFVAAPSVSYLCAIISDISENVRKRSKRPPGRDWIIIQKTDRRNASTTALESVILRRAARVVPSQSTARCPRFLRSNQAMCHQYSRAFCVAGNQARCRK